MSNTQNLAGYYIAAQTGNEQGSVVLNVYAPVGGELTDDGFLAIATAIEAAFPADWNVTIASGNLSVFKQTNVIETWNADTSQTPPVFS